MSERTSGERRPRTESEPRGGRRLAVAHCSGQMYGADRQLLESVMGLRGAGWDVVVHLPEYGPLVGELESAGAEVVVFGFPVLRKSQLSPVGIAVLVASALPVLGRLGRALLRERPEAVYVNTVTIPWWLLAAKVLGIPAVCHVHEAQETGSLLLRTALSAPLVLASRVIVNSRSARRAVIDVMPRLGARLVVVYNGVREPLDRPGGPRGWTGPVAHLALVGRVSPRKGTDVAIEALALLTRAGREVTLDICGSAFRGYEWFEEALIARSRELDLRDRVTWHGYVTSVGPILAEADILLVPSREEPFGNVAVEGQFAALPVIASRVQGLAEIIDDGRTGLLVPAGDAAALAEATCRVLDDPELARQMSIEGRKEALARFGVERYRTDVVAIVDAVANSGRPAWWRQRPRTYLSDGTVPERRTFEASSRHKRS